MHEKVDYEVDSNLSHILTPILDVNLKGYRFFYIIYIYSPLEIILHYMFTPLWRAHRGGGSGGPPPWQF